MFSWLNSEMFINAINIIAAHAVIYLQGIIIGFTLLALSLIIYFVGFHAELPRTNIPSYIEPEDDVDNEDNERKLFLVTKLVKKTYDKIYGRESKRFYPRMISAERSTKKRKKVSFVDKTIEYEI